MKKFYSILLGGILALTCAGTARADAKTVPYSSPIAISSSEFDDGWTQIDANNDADGTRGIWGPYSRSGYNNPNPAGVAARYYSFTGESLADDYLVSPAIHLEADTEYMIRYGIATELPSYPKNVYLFASTTNTAEAFQATEPLQYLPNYTDNQFKIQNVTFTPDEAGDYYFAIYTNSPNQNYYLFASTFAVYKNEFTPKGVTNLNAERNNDTPRKVECTLSWKLPTQSVFDEEFTDAQKYEQVNIYRDGSAIKSLIDGVDDDLETFVDDDEHGLKAGIHTYEVEVVVAGAVSPKVSATTKYVGPVTPATVPSTWSCATADDFEDWTVIKGTGSVNTNNWEFNSTYKSARFSEKYNEKENDFLAAPPFNITEAGYYLVTLNACPSTMSYDYTMKLVYGKAATEEGLSTVICEKVPFTSNSNTPYSFVVKIDDPDIYYFAAVAASEGSGYQYDTTLYVYSIGLEKTEKTPAAVTELTATPGANDALTVTLDWTCPDKSSNGEDLSAEEYSIEVYRGEQLIGQPLAGGTSTYTDNVAEPGAYTYTVKTVAPKGASVGGVTVTTSWVGSHVVSLPYSTKFAKTDETIAIWDVIDNNGDDKTWKHESSESSFRCWYSAPDGDGTYPYDDYLLTPHFDLTTGYYNLEFRLFGPTGTKLKVGLVKAGEFIPGQTEILFSDEITASSLSTSDSSNPLKSYTYKIEEEGIYQVVFAATENGPAPGYLNSAYYLLGVGSFSFAEYPVLPDVVTDLTVTPAENQVLEATISWTNPTTTNVDDVDLKEITKAAIYRDGEWVTDVTDNLVPGRTSTFTDTEEYGLTPGRHTYKVEVYNKSGKSTAAAPEVISEWIGGALEAPVVFAQDGRGNYKFDEWQFIDVDNNQSSSYNGWSISGSTAMKVDETGSSYDDWAISLPVNIKSWMLYELTFETYLGASYKDYAEKGGYTFDVYMGSGSNTEEFVKVGSVTSVNPNGMATSGYETTRLYIAGLDANETIKTMAVTLPEDEVDTVDRVVVPAGSLSIALHANTKGGVFVKTVSIEAVGQTSVDEVVADKDGKLFFDGAGLCFNGTATDVRVFDLTGKLVAAVAAAEGSVDLSDLENGLYIVTMNLNGEAVTVKVVK